MSGTGDQSPASPDQRWYIYSRGHLQTAPRIYGVGKFWFVYIHLNRGTATYTVNYDFQSVKAVPQNQQNLASLASILFSQQQATQQNKDSSDENNNNVWGGKEINFPFTTSDITITPTMQIQGGGSAKMSDANKTKAIVISSLSPQAVMVNSGAFTLTVNGTGFVSGATVNLNKIPLPSTLLSANQVTASVTADKIATAGSVPVTITGSGSPEPSAIFTITTTAPPQQKSANDGSLGAPQAFHNEAASWWDVSLGFPVTNVNQLSFSQSSTVGALTPAQTDKKKLVGLLNLYSLPVQQRQISANGFSWIPSVVIGLPLASQPLHKPLAALGWGPPLVQFYIGAVVVEQPSRPTGTPVIGNACYGWCPQFTFGINFGVKAALNKITSSKSTSK